MNPSACSIPASPRGKRLLCILTAGPAALYILSWSDFVRRDEHGQTVLDSLDIRSVALGSALWTPSLAPHTLENVGTSELRVIAVELKQNQHPR